MKLKNSIVLASIFLIIPIDSNASLLNRVSKASQMHCARLSSRSPRLLRSYSNVRNDNTKPQESSADFEKIKLAYNGLNSDLMNVIRNGGSQQVIYDFERQFYYQLPLVQANCALWQTLMMLEKVQADAKAINKDALDQAQQKELADIQASLAMRHNSTLGIMEVIANHPRFNDQLKINELRRVADALEKISSK